MASVALANNDLVIFVFKNHARTDVTYIKGWTAEDWAKENGHAGAANILQRLAVQNP